MEKRGREAFFELSSLIQEELNIKAILPYLIKHDLTTTEEREMLLNPSMCDFDKKQRFLFSCLPSKGNNSLDRFIEALKESTEGTTHQVLAHKIQEKRLAKAGTIHETLACKTQEERLAKTDEGMYIASL